MDLVSDDGEVSTDQSQLTTFISDSTFAIPQGETILGQRIPQTIVYTSRTIVRGYLDNLVFKGTFDAIFRSHLGVVDINGIFEVHVV